MRSGDKGAKRKHLIAIKGYHAYIIKTLTHSLTSHVFHIQLGLSPEFSYLGSQNLERLHTGAAKSCVKSML